MSNTIAQSLLGIITVDSNTIYTMESTHTKINLNDGKLEIRWGKSKNTDFLEKYRPFLTIFLRKSVLRTKLYMQTKLSSLCYYLQIANNFLGI